MKASFFLGLAMATFALANPVPEAADTAVEDVSAFKHIMTAEVPVDLVTRAPTPGLNRRVPQKKGKQIPDISNTVSRVANAIRLWGHSRFWQHWDSKTSLSSHGIYRVSCLPMLGPQVRHKSPLSDGQNLPSFDIRSNIITAKKGA